LVLHFTLEVEINSKDFRKIRTSTYLSMAGFFSIPFPFFGIEVNSISIYFPCLIALIDYRFLYSFVFSKFRTRKGVLFFFLFILFLVEFSTFSFGTEPEAVRTILKIVLLFYVFEYFRASIKTVGLTPVCSGLTVASILAIAQFYEANYLHSSFLAPKTWIFQFSLLGQKVFFPLGNALGISYATGFFGGLARVSGGAVEPGHFSATLFALLPIVLYRASTSLKVLWLAALITCFSKVTYLQSAFLLFFPFFYLFPAISFMTLIVGSSLIGYFLIDSMGGLVNFASHIDPSILERVRGFFLFWDFPLTSQLIGAGMDGACNILPDSVLKLAEGGNSVVVAESGRITCSVGVHSGIASMIITIGIFGVTMLSILIGILFFKVDCFTRRFKVLCLVAFLAGIQSVHFLTTYPAFIFNLALLFGLSTKDLKRLL